MPGNVGVAVAPVLAPVQAPAPYMTPALQHNFSYPVPPQAYAAHGTHAAQETNTAPLSPGQSHPTQEQAPYRPPPQQHYGTSLGYS